MQVTNDLPIVQDRKQNVESQLYQISSDVMESAQKIEQMKRDLGNEYKSFGEMFKQKQLVDVLRESLLNLKEGDTVFVKCQSDSKWYRETVIGVQTDWTRDGLVIDLCTGDEDGATSNTLMCPNNLIVCDLPQWRVWPLIESEQQTKSIIQAVTPIYLGSRFCK